MANEPIYRAIQALRAELARIDYVIQAVESIARGKPRRGRPPKFLSEVMKNSKSSKRKTRRRSAKP